MPNPPNRPTTSETSPPTPIEAQPTHAPGPDGRPARPGQQSNHTVRRWQQHAPGLREPRPATQELPSAQAEVQADAPSPQVEPIYLRGTANAVHPKSREPLAKAVDPDEALVDGISRSVMALFEHSIRTSVIAAVRALAPHMVITFPSTPNPDGHAATAQVARPVVKAVDEEAVDTPRT